MDAARAQLEAGFACLKAGEWTEAIRHLSAVIRRQPGDLKIVRALATAHLRAGNPAGARKVLADFILAHPLSAEGWRLAALLEWKLCQSTEAIRLIDRGLERLPMSAALQRQRALFIGAVEGATEPAPDLQASSVVAASDWLDRVAQDPAVLDGVMRVASGREDVPFLRELADRVAQLIEAQPGHADRHVALARLRLSAGDRMGARVSIERALAVNPYYADARRMQLELRGAVQQSAVEWRKAA
jgi:predicted Zn-dependent protease